MIIRAPRPETGWTTVPNSLSRDRRLSFTARGVLLYLISRPDNWQCSTANLINECADSEKPVKRDGIRTLLNELERHGYIHRVQRRGKNGRMARVDTYVSECPEALRYFVGNLPEPDKTGAENVVVKSDRDTSDCGSDDTGDGLDGSGVAEPEPDKPEPDSPDTVSPPLSNTYKDKGLPIKEIKTEENARARDASAPPPAGGGYTPSPADWLASGSDTESLAAFLLLYPKPPTNKRDARHQWNRERDGGSCEQNAEGILFALTQQLARCENYSNPRFVVKPETYLADEKWLDKIVGDNSPPKGEGVWHNLEDRLRAEYGMGGGDDDDVIEGEVTRDQE